MFRHKFANKVLILREHAQISIYSHVEMKKRLLSIHSPDYHRDVRIMIQTMSPLSNDVIAKAFWFISMEISW